MTFHNNRDIIDDFWFLINFGLMPYSFVLGQILALSLYPCELLINLSAMLFLYVSVSIVTIMLFRTMPFSIFSHGL